ncbi:MAG TPA: ATP-binding cassette domain-containing protein, partial [Phormidium sp.]
MLEIKDIHTYYGNIHALKGVSLTVSQGEVVTLIGSNGAGKTTTLRTIQGLLRPRQGTVLFEGKPLEALSTEAIVRLGISQSPEGRLIFPRMTVQENLEMGAYLRNDTLGIKSDMEKALNLFPRLRERISQ